MRSALSLVVVAVVTLSAVAVAPAAGAVAADVDTSDRSPTTPNDSRSGSANESVATNATLAGASTHDACEPVANGTPRANPATDRLGWEGGCWYNESISVTREDGLNETELDAVVARAMARVEAIRQLEFAETVPVEVISRAEFRESRESDDSSTSTANYLHQNVKWEAMLSVGESENALSIFESTQTATIGGFYNFVQDRIVIVSENATAPKMDEITLSQELFHALQDQKLRVSFDDRSTREGQNAGLGIIEGDGNLVDRFYGQRCAGAWDCLLPESSGGGGGGAGSINYGVYLTQFQPYSDGPKFVRQIYNAGDGWDAVNAVYDNPPESTEQVIHPEKYPDEGPAEMTFTDRSSDEWTVPDLGGGTTDYATFGQAGLSAMFMRPAFESGGLDTPVVGPSEFYNLTASNEPSDFDPLNYGLNVTDGWGNDRLYPYVTDDSAETNETGYVWKTVWDSEADAQEFAEGYTSLIEYYGADPVADRTSTYRIPDNGTFGDAFYVNATGATVTLVNAPTAAALSEVRAGAAPEETTPTATPSPTPSPTSTATPTATPSPIDSPTPTSTPTDASGGILDPGSTDDPGPTDGSGPETPETDGDSGDGGPGFGVAAALVALLAASLARRRW